MVANIIPQCKQASCSIAAGGRCLEGFEPLDSCPHFLGRQLAPQLDRAADVVEAMSVAATIQLRDGGALTSDDASIVMCRTWSRVIVLAGEIDAGKTTLLASLHQKFLAGPFGGFLFARSDTLPAFEQRCHLARIASGRIESHTERTPLTAGVHYLHLGLRSEPAPIQSLLFADVPGELYEKLIDSDDAAAALGVVRRADRLTLLIDGAKLVNDVDRRLAITRARDLLRCMLDCGLLQARTSVDIVFTKWDLAHVVANSLVEHEQRLKKLIENRVAEVRLWHIAARPRVPSDFSAAHGLDGLLQAWLSSPERVNSRTSRFDAVAAREFDRYLERWTVTGRSAQE
jgi:hypothetical protein